MSLVDDRDPLQQGLKLLRQILGELLLVVDDRDPLQQGLKHYPAPPISPDGFKSTTVIHYNKD